MKEQSAPEQIQIGLDQGCEEWAVFTAYGFDVTVNVPLGHLHVVHDGTITWDQLQMIKTLAWGRDARAIEVYPRDRDVINKGHIRHLWRLGEQEFCPDLLGRDPCADNLIARHSRAWAEARI